MKIGIVPINVGYTAPEQVIAIAEKAEEVGAESVWTFEHVMVPVDYESRYPYNSKGKMPATPESNFIDPLIALSFVAARTTRLRLGTGVNILPQTNPLLAAKQVASIDFLSGGRMMYGVGTGWLREEYEAMGTPFERRGKRFDEYLVAMKKVWSGEVVEHEGELLTWKGFKSYPVPTQKPHPPLIVGGTSKAAFRRVARHGDGWIAPNFSSEQLAGQLEELRAVAKDNDRDPDSIEVTAMWRFDKDPNGETIGAFRDLGVARLLVPVFALGSEGPLAGLDRLGNDIIAKL
jgi:probable F420-dependent oxidoreductase